MCNKLSTSRNDKEDGFVLVVVMGLLLMVSIIAATLTLASRSRIQVEAALTTRAELETLADGMVRLTAFRLTFQQQQDAVSNPVSIDGAPVNCRIGDVLANIRVSDVAGLVDINSASADLLELLFIGVGIAQPDAASLSAAIQDFRDTDDVPGENGAEAPDYQQAGRPHGPKNAQFESVDELDQVLGMTPERLQALRPFVTVHSRSPILNLSVAPLPLLQALARGSNANAAWGSVIELASREQFQPPAALLTRFNTRSRSRASSRMFAIVVSVLRPNRGGYTRQAVIELATRAKTGFIIREWSSHVHGAGAVMQAADMPCVQFE